jgi:hypothetical protein
VGPGEGRFDRSLRGGLGGAPWQRGRGALQGTANKNSTNVYSTNIVERVRHGRAGLRVCMGVGYPVRHRNLRIGASHGGWGTVAVALDVENLSSRQSGPVVLVRPHFGLDLDLFKARGGLPGGPGSLPELPHASGRPPGAFGFEEACRALNKSRCPFSR